MGVYLSPTPQWYVYPPIGGDIHNFTYAGGVDFFKPNEFSKFVYSKNKIIQNQITSHQLPYLAKVTDISLACAR